MKLNVALNFESPPKPTAKSSVSEKESYED